jgi:hypothetical protein
MTDTDDGVAMLAFVARNSEAFEDLALQLPQPPPLIQTISPPTLSALARRHDISIGDDSVAGSLITYTKVLLTEILKGVITSKATMGPLVTLAPVTTGDIASAIHAAGISLTAMPLPAELARARADPGTPPADCPIHPPAFPNLDPAPPHASAVFVAVQHALNTARASNRLHTPAFSLQEAFVDMRLLTHVDLCMLTITLHGMLADLHAVYCDAHPVSIVEEHPPIPTLTPDAIALLVAAAVMLLTDIFKAAQPYTRTLDIDTLRTVVNPIIIPRLALVPRTTHVYAPLSAEILFHAAAPWVVNGRDIWPTASKEAFVHAWFDLRAYLAVTTQLITLYASGGQPPTPTRAKIIPHEFLDASEIAQRVVQTSPALFPPTQSEACAAAAANAEHSSHWQATIANFMQAGPAIHEPIHRDLNTPLADTAVLLASQVITQNHWAPVHPETIVTEDWPTID